MATNEFVNKVIYGGNTLIDLTSDTVQALKVLNGQRFHLASGEPVITAATAADATDSEPRHVVGISSKVIGDSDGYIWPSVDGDVAVESQNFYVTANAKLPKIVSTLDASLIKYNNTVTVDADPETTGVDSKNLISITGSFTGDADITAAEVLSGKIAYAKGNKITGSMANNGGVVGTISTVAGEYTVPLGFHDGSGKVSIAAAEQAKLIPANIRQGVTVLGVLGTMSGSEDVKATEADVTPTVAAQTIQPSDFGDYNYITQINVAAIPYAETDNAAGGKTVTIA